MGRGLVVGTGVGGMVDRHLIRFLSSFPPPSPYTHQITKWNEKAIDVELPPNFVYEVVETDPNFKGNTAQGGSKPAKLNSGATVNVPMFIEVGEKIKVDTREATYLSRASE